jgi:hypothetical protein
MIQHGKTVLGQLIDGAGRFTARAFGYSALVEPDDPVVGSKRRHARIPEICSPAQAAYQ